MTAADSTFPRGLISGAGARSLSYGRGLALAIAVLVGACSGPPSGTTDAAIDYQWRFAFADLEEAILSVCGTDDQVVAVGGRGRTGLVLEWEDGSWREAALPAETGTLWWCAASPSGELWAVGERATILHRETTGWTRIDASEAVPANTTLYGVHAGADQLTVVGGSLNAPGIPPVIAHRRDQSWVADTVPAQTPTPLFKVWGDSAGAIWAVGSEGAALYHGAGEPEGTWRPVESGTTQRLIAVHGNASGDVYAVGGDGVGVLIHWNGTRFVESTQTPEPLSGLLVSENSLTVGGNRGYLAAFDLNDDGEIAATPRAQTVAAADLCIHAVAAAGGAELAASADLIGGGGTSWRGSVLYRGTSLVGPVERLSSPDAGIVDAGVAAVDAAIVDGGGVDSGGGVDATSLPGRGEPCLIAFPACAPGLECWFLQVSGSYLCTESCAEAATCVGYGQACCERPGVQTLETVCLPMASAECQMPL